MSRASTSVWRRRCIGYPLFALVTMGMPRIVDAGAYDQFFRAVKTDDAGTIKSLLMRGFDPNTIEPERGDTGLILSLRDDAMKAFEVLVNAAGLDLETRSRNGDNALMIACYRGNRAAVMTLLAKGAAVNRAGWTPLHYAAASGHNDIVRLLLDRSAYIDAASPNNSTPLMMAARGGHITTVKMLLDEGANPELRNDLGMTVIDFATRHDHKDIAGFLAERLRKTGKP